MKSDSSLYAVWRTRTPNPYELNYNEVRRVTFYNPLSSNVNVQIPIPKDFTFIKSIDPVNARVKSSPMGIEVEINPQGSISLDLGHFES